MSRIEATESSAYSRDGIARTARDIRENAQRHGTNISQEAAERRVREAIRKSPTRRE